MVTCKKTKKPGAGRYRKGSTTLSEDQQQTFLDTLADGWSVTRAAADARAPNSTFYSLRDKNPVFAKKWVDAVEAGSDVLEDEARRRAARGWDEPVFYQGEQIATVRKYDSTLLMFMLNGRRPEKYRQNVKIDAPDLAASFRGAMAAATNPQPKTNGHDRSAETQTV